jgi:hypothetical protein
MSQSEAVHAYALENYDWGLPPFGPTAYRRVCYGSANAGRGSLLPRSEYRVVASS